MPKTLYAGIQARPSHRTGSRKPPPDYVRVSQQFAARKTDAAIVSGSVVIALCVDNLQRVRLMTVLETMGLHSGQPYYQRESFYLDGQRLVETIYCTGIVQREWCYMGQSVIPARSKEVVDFGRLDHAVQGLVTIMGRMQQSSASDDQLASLYASRESVLEWQRRAHAEMDIADSQVALMESMFRQVVVGESGVTHE